MWRRVLANIGWNKKKHNIDCKDGRHSSNEHALTKTKLFLYIYIFFMAFHHGFNYDYDFIIEEVAIEFKGELYCYKENTEKCKKI